VVAEPVTASGVAARRAAVSRASIFTLGRDRTRATGPADLAFGRHGPRGATLTMLGFRRHEPADGGRWIGRVAHPQPPGVGRGGSTGMGNTGTGSDGTAVWPIAPAVAATRTKTIDAS